MRKGQQGFTLIEIAIVLVIIGLLLGGVLKGQELVQNARVRNVISLQDGVKAAFFGFQDRYRGVPGDYTVANAQANIPNAGAVCGGNSNSLIDAAVNGVGESICAWFHLSRAGFITGTYTGIGATNDAAQANATNTPSNPFGGFMQLFFDNNYSGLNNAIHNVKTGTNIPSTVLAEIDRKIDDGLPDTGTFRFSPWQGSTAATCTVIAAPAVTTWSVANNASQCGASSLF